MWWAFAVGWCIMRAFNGYSFQLNARRDRTRISGRSCAFYVIFKIEIISLCLCVLFKLLFFFLELAVENLILFFIYSKIDFVF